MKVRAEIELLDKRYCLSQDVALCSLYQTAGFNITGMETVKTVLNESLMLLVGHQVISYVLTFLEMKFNGTVNPENLKNFNKKEQLIKTLNLNEEDKEKKEKLVEAFQELKDLDLPDTLAINFFLVIE